MFVTSTSRRMSDGRGARRRENVETLDVQVADRCQTARSLRDTDRVREIFVESAAGMAYESGAAVWSFDLDLWGTCVQAPAVEEAVQAFERAYGPAVVMERIGGDEQAFLRDRAPASDTELAVTLETLATQRRRTLRLLERLPDAVLDRDDPQRHMPTWARWRTIRDNLWHIADTESRYYLPSLDLPSKERAPDLETELRASATHVHEVVHHLPRDLVVSGDEVWTSTKVLRRLAWHEAGEVDAIEALLKSWSFKG